MDRPLVSVIVPIYNVEPYLQRCCESIAAQTCDNLEVILVVDGDQSDGSEELAGEWSRRDRRFIVVKQPHGGLAAARNTAIERASGTWLMAVDGDDYVPRDAIANLMAAVTADTDVVAGDWILFDDGSEPRGGKSRAAGTITMTGDEALEAILYQDGRLTGSVCARLLRRSLFDEVRFPPGRLYEDLAVARQLYRQVRRVAVIPQVVYYYRQHRRGSILDDFKPQRADVLDILEAQLHDADDAMTPAYKARLLAAAFNLWRLAPKSADYDALRGRCRAIIKRYRRECITNSKVRLRDRAASLASYLFIG